MHRRAFLALTAGSVAAAAVSVAAGMFVGAEATPVKVVAPRAAGVPRPFPRPMPGPVPLPRHFLAPQFAPVEREPGALFGLPDGSSAIALTVDDGTDSSVVAAYADFCATTGMRLTFFLNGIRPSWTDNAPALRTLIASGQVQLGNHTWSHPDLTTLSSSAIADELSRNHDFIESTYGVDARPYFRPPYGRRDDRVDAAAASVGYTVPVMWYGSLSDSTEITDAQLLDSATQWILPAHIVIGHANFPTVTRHFADLVKLIGDRGLTPVTLDDVFLRG